MAEQPPSPERTDKFSSPRDEVLYIMAQNGWANEVSGEVGGSSGWFARVINSEDELMEIKFAFSEQIERVGLTDLSELLGYWIVNENNLGFVEAINCESEQRLDYMYDLFENIYQAWQRGERE